MEDKEMDLNATLMKNCANEIDESLKELLENSGLPYVKKAKVLLKDMEELGKSEKANK